jgi:hypothetical protein
MTGKVIDFNSRSVGDVPAPFVENECCKCRTKLMRRKKSDSYICDACFDIMQSDGEGGLAVKLATSVERAATLKLLKHLGGETNNIVARKWLKKARDIIEKGAHL